MHLQQKVYHVPSTAGAFLLALHSEALLDINLRARKRDTQ